MQQLTSLLAKQRDESPEFSDKERINLEIMAERQPNPTSSDHYLTLAQTIQERIARAIR